MLVLVLVLVLVPGSGVSAGPSWEEKEQEW